MRKYNKSLFIFRRDFRLDDNSALLAALKSSSEVVPAFIFDPRQIGENPYKSEFAIDFMIGSLKDLEEGLKRNGGKLYFFEGQAHDVVEKIIQSEKIQAVYVNIDYTPFSKKRDTEIQQVCQKKGVNFHAFHDALLNPPDRVRKADGGVYTIYTPYFRKASSYEVLKPVLNNFKNYSQRLIRFEKRQFIDFFSLKVKKNNLYPPGRKHALKILNNIKSFGNYDHDRNMPHLQATTGLSAHHKFGNCSARETFHAVSQELGPDSTIIRELYWRDFFTQIGFHFPRVLGESFHPQFNKVQWGNDLNNFSAWCEGMTGFPIVDAGMRELNETGFMHNRLRMITASFLVKDLHIDWRWGEKYFAQKLLDYDPLVNNGNWQWVASTGCDAQPYFRIFNPWLQQKKFDPQALYIKKWVPELRGLSAMEIHGLENAKIFRPQEYPETLVDHKLQAQRAVSIFKSV